MKASQIIKNTSQDSLGSKFSNKDLRGRDFRKQILIGEIFDNSDIRGANFEGANLDSASFIGVKTGFQYQWKVFLIGIVLFLVFFSGIAAGHAGSLVAVNPFPEDSEKYLIIYRSPFLLVLTAFVILTIKRGFSIAMTVTTLLITGSVLLILFPITFSQNEDLISIFDYTIRELAGAVIWGATSSVTLTVSGTIIRIWKFPSFMVLTISILGTLFIALLETANPEHNAVWDKPDGWLIAWIVSLCLDLIGSYAAQQAEKERENFKWVKKSAIALNCIGGTSFRRAILIETNFSRSNLGNCDFRYAYIERVSWYGVENLEYSRLGDSYLQIPSIRKLLTTGCGIDEKFVYLNLQGINLNNADLRHAEFTGTNLSHSVLKGVNLSGACLKQTRLDSADLTGASLTGAFIEGWGISSTTKLDSVVCDFIYMRHPTKAEPDPLRKPDNRNEKFKDGDFFDFIKPLKDTLDLYHNQDIDPRKMALSFKKLAEDNPEAKLELIAIEKTENDNILLRAKTSDRADKSVLSKEYFDFYHELKISPKIVSSLLSIHDDKINNLQNTISTLMQKPSFYIENIEQFGGKNVNEYSGINIQESNEVTLSGVATGGSFTNLGTVNGNIKAAINGLSDSVEPDTVSIKHLLTKLHEATLNDTFLDEDSKIISLEQLGVLADAGKKSSQQESKKLAKRATVILKGIASSLPEFTKFTEACNSLIPELSKLFGL